MDNITITLTLVWRTTITTITIAIPQCERSKTDYYYTMRATITVLQLQLQYHSVSVARRARPQIDPARICWYIYDVWYILPRKNQSERRYTISVVFDGHDGKPKTLKTNNNQLFLLRV